MHVRVPVPTGNILVSKQSESLGLEITLLQSYGIYTAVRFYLTEANVITRLCPSFSIYCRRKLHCPRSLSIHNHSPSNPSSTKMRLTSKLILGTLLGVATAAPDLDGRNALKDRSTLVPRGTFCEQYANETYGNYVVFNNLWGKDDATSGSQCTTVSGGEEDTVVWSTSWTWFVSSILQ